MRKQKIIKQKIKVLRKLLNKSRDTLSSNEINEIRHNLYKKETIYDFLTNKDKLKSNEQRVLNRIDSYLNELYDDLLKKSKYKQNYLYGLEQLLNDDVYYKPIEVKNCFKGNYVKCESNGDKDRSSSITLYFLKVEPFLYDLIDFYKTISEWKIQLSMQVNFIADNYDDKGLILHTKSDNVEIMRGIDTKTIVTKLYDTLKQRYQEGLEMKMDASNYIFDRVVLLEYHFHKVSLKRVSSYTPSPKWLINKKSTLDPHNKEDNWCFLFAIVLALNYQSISNNPQRVNNLMPFIPNYNWDNIEFPLGFKEYTIFERDNCDIALNILYVPHKTQEIRPAYISKHNKT